MKNGAPDLTEIWNIIVSDIAIFVLKRDVKPYSLRLRLTVVQVSKQGCVACGVCVNYQLATLDLTLFDTSTPHKIVFTGSIARSANLPVFRLLRGRF